MARPRQLTGIRRMAPGSDASVLEFSVFDKAEPVAESAAGAPDVGPHWNKTTGYGANPQREKAFVPAVMWGGANSFEQSADGVG